MSVTRVEISQNWSRELSRKELEGREERGEEEVREERGEEEVREERGEEEGGNGVRQCRKLGGHLGARLKYSIDSSKNCPRGVAEFSE